MRFIFGVFFLLISFYAYSAHSNYSEQRLDRGQHATLLDSLFSHDYDRQELHTMMSGKDVMASPTQLMNGIVQRISNDALDKHSIERGTNALEILLIQYPMSVPSSYALCGLITNDAKKQESLMHARALLFKKPYLHTILINGGLLSKSNEALLALADSQQDHAVGTALRKAFIETSPHRIFNGAIGLLKLFLGF